MALPQAADQQPVVLAPCLQVRGEPRGIGWRRGDTPAPFDSGGELPRSPNIARADSIVAAERGGEVARQRVTVQVRRPTDRFAF
jgi:hypothetical protein